MSTLVLPETLGQDNGLMGFHLDSRFLSLVVHDLRTPLNVIGLTLRLISQSVPKGNSDLDEDIHVVQENLGQIERMLVHLSDYCRLVEDKVAPRPTPFDPRQLIRDLVDERAARSAPGASRVRFAVKDGCPPEVELDPAWARLAVQHALSNALSASEGGPVDVTLDGSDGRLTVGLDIERAPPPSVQSIELRSDIYERLFGTAQERRGLDLAIAARVSELFGGTARLDVLGDRGTRIVLDWPARLPAA
jgi:signal transduction histidine kinase